MLVDDSLTVDEVWGEYNQFEIHKLCLESYLLSRGLYLFCRNRTWNVDYHCSSSPTLSWSPGLFVTN